MATLDEKLAALVAEAEAGAAARSAAPQAAPLLDSAAALSPEPASPIAPAPTPLVDDLAAARQQIENPTLLGSETLGSVARGIGDFLAGFGGDPAGVLKSRAAAQTGIDLASRLAETPAFQSASPSDQILIADAAKRGDVDFLSQMQDRLMRRQAAGAKAGAKSVLGKSFIERAQQQFPSLATPENLAFSQLQQLEAAGASDAQLRTAFNDFIKAGKESRDKEEDKALVKTLGPMVKKLKDSPVKKFVNQLMLQGKGKEAFSVLQSQNALDRQTEGQVLGARLQLAGKRLDNVNEDLRKLASVSKIDEIRQGLADRVKTVGEAIDLSKETLSLSLPKMSQAQIRGLQEHFLTLPSDTPLEDALNSLGGLLLPQAQRTKWAELQRQKEKLEQEVEGIIQGKAAAAEARRPVSQEQEAQQVFQEFQKLTPEQAAALEQQLIQEAQQEQQSKGQ